MLVKIQLRFFVPVLILAGACTLNAQITVDPNPQEILVDKNSAGTITLTLRNTSAAAVPLQLSVDDFVHLENGKPTYPLYTPVSTLTPNTPADKTIIDSKQLAANTSVEVKLAVTQLWEAGESVANLRNNNAAIATVRAIKIPGPYNVQLDPATAIIPITSSSPGDVGLVNNDSMDYSFSWELSARDGCSIPASTANRVTVPANGSVRIKLAVPGSCISFWSAGFLKENVVDAQLILHPLVETQQGIPPQASKSFPVKLRERYFSSDAQEVTEVVVTALLLLTGALASLAARYYIPNALGAITLRKQLRQMSAKCDGMGEGVDSKWPTLLTYNADVCMSGLYELPAVFPAFATRLTELQEQAKMFGQWVDIAYEVGEILDLGTPLLQAGSMPPTVYSLVKKDCQTALQPITSGMTNDEELQRMKAALKSAQDLVAAVDAGAVIPALEAILQEREKRLQDNNPIDGLKQQIPQFGELFDQVKASLGKPFSPATYVSRDVRSRKAELLLDYCDLVAQYKAGGLDAQVRLNAAAPRFLDYVAPDSVISLQRAQIFLTEMHEDFYTDPPLKGAATAEPRQIAIRAGTSPTEAGALIHFALRFVRDELNGTAASQEWTPYWDFGDGTPKVKGWDSYHRFRTGGDLTVTVEVVDLKGSTITTLSKPYTVAASQPATGRKFKVAGLTPEAKVEAAHLGIILAVALFGVFAAARGTIESMSTMSAATTLIGIGFGADTLKNLVAQKATD